MNNQETRKTCRSPKRGSLTEKTKSKKDIQPPESSEESYISSHNTDDPIVDNDDELMMKKFV